MGSTTRDDLSDHDRQQVEAFEDDLEMASRLANRWDISFDEATYWLEEQGYTGPQDLGPTVGIEAIDGHHAGYRAWYDHWDGYAHTSYQAFAETIPAALRRLADKMEERA